MPARSPLQRLGHDLEDARVHQPGRHQLDQLVQVDAGALADRKGLGGRGADRLRDEVVQQLDDVPGAGPADVEHVLGKAAQHRLERARRSAASAPTITLSLPASASTGVRASGASTKLTPAAAQGSRSLAVESGSLVELSTIIRPWRRAGEQAVGARHRGLDLRRAGDAQEHDVAAAASAGRRRGLGRAGGQQVGHALAVAVHGERQRVALGEQVLRHAVAHQSRGADESDALHVQSP